MCKLIAYHNKGQAGILAEGTLKNYYTSERYIHKFLKEQYKTTDKHLTELSYSFILNFERYLRNHKPSGHHRPLNNNGIMKHIERFRKIFSLGVTLEWLEKDPFTKYKQKFDRVESQFLNIQELNRGKEFRYRASATGKRPLCVQLLYRTFLYRCNEPPARQCYDWSGW